MQIKTKIFYMILFVIVAEGIDENPIIEIKHGKIKGVSLKTDSGKSYHAFKEIPYAKPPVGNLRFTEPTYPEQWNDIKDATKNVKLCLQQKDNNLEDIGNYTLSEDCLYLNVYTPAVTPRYKELPVYVFIHGGVFVIGNPYAFHFDFFIDEDIIVVAMAYRLTALGFLSTGDGVIPGNLGLKDQIHAFKWVQENIKYFGGDPNKVTIGGHSSGAECVGYHILNPRLKGLFRGGIIESGSPMNPLYNANATHTAYNFAEQLDPNVRSKTTHELLDYLRTLPAEALAFPNFKNVPDYFDSIALKRNQPWFPSIENDTFKNVAVSGPKHDNLENGISTHVPVLMGIASQENLLYNAPKLMERIKSNFSRVLDPTIKIRPENRTKALLELKRIYTQTENLIDNVTALFELHCDLIFNVPIINFAYLHSNYANVFFYEFSYKGTINGGGRWFGGPYFNKEALNRTDHCAELPFLYKYKLDPTLTPSSDDLLQRKKLVKLWTNFIKYLTPTPKPDPLLQNFIWPPVTRSEFKYVDINKNFTMKTNPKRFKDWQMKMQKYFERPQYVF